MPVRYRIALHGFSHFERDTLSFCFKHTRGEEQWYELVNTLAESDFVVADAEHEALDNRIAAAGRVGDTLFVGLKAPPGAASHVKRPIDPQRILRALDDMVLMLRSTLRVTLDAALPPVVRQVPQKGPRTAATNSGTQPDRGSFTDDSTVPITLRRELMTEPPSVTPSAPAPPARKAASTDPAPVEGPSTKKTPVRSEAERVAAKEAARRAARLARLTQAKRAGQTSPALIDALILDREPAPGNLCSLLEAFGFRVHRFGSSEQALALLRDTALAAAFVNLTPSDFDDAEGLDLCRRIKQREVNIAGEIPPVVMVCSRATPTTRVQAKLAGADAFLTSPVRRGDVARTLEGNGVALPTDQRRR